MIPDSSNGSHWREFNASLVWPVRAGLEAALKVADAEDSGDEDHG